MALRGEILMRLDVSSLKAFVLYALIGRQRKLNEIGIGNSHIHATDVHRYLGETCPNLEIDYKTTVDTLHALDEEELLTSQDASGGPSYKLNPNCLEESE